MQRMLTRALHESDSPIAYGGSDFEDESANFFSWIKALGCACCAVIIIVAIVSGIMAHAASTSEYDENHHSEHNSTSTENHNLLRHEEAALAGEIAD
ncbi:MAG: hypothetical protein RLN62_04195 [Rickettsiales bacterium]